MTKPSSMTLAFVLVTAGCGHTTADGSNPSNACRREAIRGHVSKGEEFEWRFADELAFVLEPELSPQNPSGWTIRVAPVAARDADYSMVATPPFRFRNPRYVDTGYGVTAAAALAWTPRRFAFVASSQDYDSAMRSLDILLWPGNQTQARVDSAQRAIEQLRTYPGTFLIEEGAAAPPSSDHPNGVIERISFQVELCVPGR